MTEKVDRVTAKFGGRDITFVIERELIPFFEQAIGEPAQLRLNRIAAGQATVRDIMSVVSYAAPKGLGAQIPVGSTDAMMAQMRRTLDELKKPPKTFVSETFAKYPPLKYAVLAQGILAAALYGIPREAAHFDEDEEDAGGE